MSRWSRLHASLAAVALLVVTAAVPGPARAAADDTGAGRLAAGDQHSCALDDGDVRCWGLAADGRLGHDTTANVGDGTGPTVEEMGAVPLPDKATYLAAGAASTCVVLTTGAVHCWGKVARGAIDLSGPATAVAVAKRHACAVLRSGQVECWRGKQRFTIAIDAGAVAAGGDVTCALGRDAGVACWALGGRPRQVRLPAPATGLTVGDGHACVVQTGGAVRCWGTGARGGPPVVVPLAGKAEQVAAGGDRTCAIVGNGAVQCWQHGGQTTGAVLQEGASTIAVGPEHGCVEVDHAVECWGQGGSGRLGYDDGRARPLVEPGGRTASPSPGPGDEVVFGGGSQAEGSNAPETHGDGSGPWGWVLGVLALAGGAGVVVFLTRRRDRTGG